MRNFAIVVSLIVLFIVVGVAGTHAKPYTYEPQYAEGEWKIEVQTPPCDKLPNGAPNMEVIYPKESGAPITIECNAMPVGTK